MHNNSYICSAGSGWPCLVAVCVPLLQPHPGGNSRPEGSSASQVHDRHWFSILIARYYQPGVVVLGTGILYICWLHGTRPVSHVPVLPARHGRHLYSILIDCTVSHVPVLPARYGRHWLHGITRTGITSQAWSSLIARYHTYRYYQPGMVIIGNLFWLHGITRTGITSQAWSSLVFYFDCTVTHIPVLPARHDRLWNSILIDCIDIVQVITENDLLMLIML